MFERACKNLDYWFRVMEIDQEAALTWRLSPNGEWPEEQSFGFHFSRDCLSFKTPCTFRPIKGTAAYRLKYPQVITDPRSHPNVLEAALFARLTAL